MFRTAEKTMFHHVKFLFFFAQYSMFCPIVTQSSAHVRFFCDHLILVLFRHCALLGRKTKNKSGTLGFNAAHQKRRIKVEATVAPTSPPPCCGASEANVSITFNIDSLLAAITSSEPASHSRWRADTSPLLIFLWRRLMCYFIPLSNGARVKRRSTVAEESPPPHTL